MRVFLIKLRVEIESEMRVFLETLNFEIEMRLSQKSASFNVAITKQLYLYLSVQRNYFGRTVPQPTMQLSPPEVWNSLSSTRPTKG